MSLSNLARELDQEKRIPINTIDLKQIALGPNMETKQSTEDDGDHLRGAAIFLRITNSPYCSVKFLGEFLLSFWAEHFLLSFAEHFSFWAEHFLFLNH